MVTPASVGSFSRVSRILIAAALCAPAFAADKSEISSDITVHSKAVGPALAVPPPTATRPVIDEVLDSLSLGRGDAASGPETVRVEADTARVSGLFPQPPFLAFTPARVRARYDDWTFQVLDEEKAVWSVGGVGPARDDLSWDGRGTDGRLAAAGGRSYRYRFTGRRGGKSFAVESDPVTLRSFSDREYQGETRLEVDAALLFAEGKATLLESAERYLAEIAARLAAADAREDGSYRCEYYAAAPSTGLARARAKAFAAALAADLKTAADNVNVSALPAERGGESFAAFVPVSRGPALRNE
jgi:hypothetical protein